jgi:signal transduction histidine kinase
MEEAVILVDLQGKIVLVNPRIAMLGLRPADLQDHYLGELLRDTSIELVQHLGFSSVQEMGQVFYDLGRTDDLWEKYNSQLYMIRVEQRELYMQRYILPVKDNRGETIGALLVFYNKTEEQELNRAREEFSRMIVHDLRSPLTAVTTSLKLLREVVAEGNEAYPVVQTATDGSNRVIRKLLGRVSSLLDIAKMESGQLSIETDITELTPLAENVCAELKPLAQELAIVLTIQKEAGVAPFHVDADKVERLLLNLVDNALKYSPTESEIVIRIHPPGGHEVGDGFARVEVVDRGPGVPDEYKLKLFDRFVQIEGRQKVRRGVGLGLTFCKLVVETHGGRIWIEDNPGGGSIFAFTLPVADLTRLPDDE